MIQLIKLASQATNIDFPVYTLLLFWIDCAVCINFGPLPIVTVINYVCILQIWVSLDVINFDQLFKPMFVCRSYSSFKLQLLFKLQMLQIFLQAQLINSFLQQTSFKIQHLLIFRWYHWHCRMLVWIHSDQVDHTQHSSWLRHTPVSHI